jgi:hypothetical protein
MDDFQQAIFLKRRGFSVELAKLCEAIPAEDHIEEVFKNYF